MGVRPEGARDPALRRVAILAGLLTAGAIAVWVFVVDDGLPTYGPSMRPTLGGRVNLDIDQDAYDRARPAFGDVVAAQAPSGADAETCGAVHSPRSPCPRPQADYSAVFVIKRVVALPGDRVGFTDAGRLVRNGERYREPYIRRCMIPCGLPRAIRVPREHYFLAGDNRPVSSDSRFWGPVPLEAIEGKVILP